MRGYYYRDGIMVSKKERKRKPALAAGSQASRERSPERCKFNGGTFLLCLACSLGGLLCYTSAARPGGGLSLPDFRWFAALFSLISFVFSFSRGAAAKAKVAN